MKNATHILSSLRHQPQFKKLTHFECIKRIQTLFPPHLQRLVLYGYIRNQILYFVLNHPGAKQEFDIIIGSIKAPLKHYTPPECSDTSFSDIRAYVSHKRPLSETKKRPTVYQFHERSLGNFSNGTRHQTLHNIIENIRQIIHESKH